jgi:hypothetical protein
MKTSDKIALYGMATVVLFTYMITLEASIINLVYGNVISASICFATVAILSMMLFLGCIYAKILTAGRKIR